MAALVLEPACLVCDHAPPTTANSHGIGPSEHIVPARRCTSAGEEGKEDEASREPIEVSRSESIVELERHDEVDGACGCIVCPAFRVDIGREKELSRFHGVEVDVVQKEYAVELDAIRVDGGEGSVAHLGEKGDPLKASFPGGKRYAGEREKVEVFVDNGGVTC